jgi:RsiW-degrading membrane proteinase PrsW (M82 family)
MFSSWGLFFLITLSSIPIFIVYIWFRLAKYQFSIILFLLALLMGAAAFFPALILQDLLPFQVFGRWELFYYFFIRVAFSEELSRLLMLFIFVWIGSRIRTQDFTVKKGAAAGLVAGLGFAFLENTVYGASDAGLLLLRAFTAAPLHAACGSRVGAAVVMFRTSPIQALLRFFTAVIIHGIYNFMTVVPGFPSIMPVLIALTALSSSILTIRGNWDETEKPDEV